MKIAKIEDCSLIDYPHKIASVVFVYGCNLKCPYCHNPELLIPIPEKYMFPHVALKRIKENSRFIEGVVITGGEPCANLGLLQFVRSIKKIGLDVKVDTNGTYSFVVEHLLDMIDYIAMDIKTDSRMYGKMSIWKEWSISSSIAMIMDSNIEEYEFRCTAFYPFVRDDNIHAIGRMIEGATNFYLQEGRIDKKMLDPDFPMYPHSREKLEEYAKILRKYIRSVEIR